MPLLAQEKQVLCNHIRSSVFTFNLFLSSNLLEALFALPRLVLFALPRLVLLALPPLVLLVFVANLPTVPSTF